MTAALLPRVLAKTVLLIGPVAGSGGSALVRGFAACAGFLSALATTGWGAEVPSLLAHAPLSLETLAEFRPTANNWRLVGEVADVSRESKTLSGSPGTGVLLNVPRPDAKGHLITTWEHADLSIEMDFLLPVGSNSGVYLQGRYEVQIFDSWAVKQPTPGDNGGIYSRWNDARGRGNESYDGHAPVANASRAPGLWQRLQINFQAPRFNAQGQKLSNAKFLKVVLNGFTVQENVEISGPTRSSLFDDEKAQGPLMIQGDHGPIALRNLAVKRFSGRPVEVTDLALKFFAGDFDEIADYESLQAKREASLPTFMDSVTEADGRGAARYLGTLVVPVTGVYAFGVNHTPSSRLLIDEQVVIRPNNGGQHVGQLTLTAGEHRFQLDHIRGSRRATARAEFWVEGPGIAPQRLGTPPESGIAKTTTKHEPIFVQPADRVLVQRAFVPFEPSKRLYAVSVGTPAGIHYAYDLEAATLLRVWRGRFLDASELWIERAEPQLGLPTGPALTLPGKPLLTIFANAQSRWPDAVPPNSASRGYRLEPNGQPVFSYEYIGVSVTDRIAPLPDGTGLTRTLRFTGKPWDRSVWVLIAEGAAIAAEGDHRFVIGDRDYYIDWPSQASLRPGIRTDHGRQQLVVHLPTDGKEYEVGYNLVW